MKNLFALTAIIGIAFAAIFAGGSREENIGKRVNIKGYPAEKTWLIVDSEVRDTPLYLLRDSEGNEFLAEVSRCEIVAEPQQ